MADSERLKQAFMNLIINAMNAMPNGGNLTITAAPAVGVGYLFVSITEYMW